MNVPLKIRGTVEQLTVIDADHFVLSFHVSQNGVQVAFMLDRQELAKASQMASEALRTTQDQVTDPEKLAAVRVEL